jgi:hypothetical protein
MCCWAQFAGPLLHYNIFCGLLRMHVGLILIFQANPLSPKRCVLKNKQVGASDKDKMMDNVQKQYLY